MDPDIKEDPALECPLLDRLPTKEELMDIMPPDGIYTNMLSFCLDNWERQSQLDQRWALLCASQGETKPRTFAQWKELYKKSGLDLVKNSSSSHRSKDLIDFPQLNECSSYTLLENFVLPKLILRKCDSCGTILDAPMFCICGETYCNESCRGKEKENHKRPCELVQENNESAMKLVVQWQRKQQIPTTTKVWGRVPREEVLVARTTMRDNILSFGGQKVVGDVFNVYLQILDHRKIPQLKALADGNGPSSVHASYYYGKICNDPAVKAAPQKLAHKYIQSAADQGLGPAWVVLGNDARDKGDIKTAKACWLRALGICRIPEAAYNLGVMYGLGYDGRRDFPMAIDFYQEAVDSPLPHCGNRTVPNEVADKMFYSMYTANNEDQSEFVSLARSNLRVVQRSCETPAKVIRYVDPPTPSSKAKNNTSDAQPRDCLKERPSMAKNNTTDTQPRDCLKEHHALTYLGYPLTPQN